MKTKDELELVLSAIGRHIDDYQEISMMELYTWIEGIMLLCDTQ